MNIKGVIEKTVAVRSSPRVKQVEGRYDLEPIEKETAAWSVDVTLPKTWSRGVIVGASGSGKTTLARMVAEKLGAVLQTPRTPDGKLIDPFTWKSDEAVIEAIAGEEGSVEDAMLLLSSVGFASPPAWRRPYHVLSNGQQFRVNLARTLAEAIAEKEGASELAATRKDRAARVRIVDEYSSVVDRTVAKVGSAAVAKTVERYGLQFIAVTCHYDVIEWLEPDWVIECHDDRTVTLTLSKTADGSARRWVRPGVDVRITRTEHSAWARFAPHHYLNHEIKPSSVPFVAWVDGQPAAFCAVIHFPQQKYGLTYREHRLVVLPDFQGIGLGNRVSEAVAAMFKATGHPYFSLTSHPALAAHRRRSPLWRQTRKPGVSNGSTGLKKRDGKVRRTSANRLTSAFEYVGPADPLGAKRFGLMNGERAKPQAVNG